MRLIAFSAAVLGCWPFAIAQTPPPPAKRLPPAGIALETKQRQALTAELEALRQAKASALLVRDPARWPDVEIFIKAVDWPLRYDEFFDPRQVASARALLQEGRDRVEHIHQGRMPWLSATGLVVRGYRSKLDGSVQPYGLVVPADWRPGESKLRPLLVWLLGRNDKRTELAFLVERQKGPPPFQPAGAIVLIPYGRFCNATKFAGEVDVFEALDAVRANYSIDPDRIAVGGFSMGGASTWHLAVHHPGRWCAAAPGAGFAETAIYTRALRPGREHPPWWEQTLWHWYDAPPYAGNLFHCPTIAYSGELDPQKLAADLMETAMTGQGVQLEHLVGPGTAHTYHPETQKQLAVRLDELLARGRDHNPAEVRFTTYTLRYPELAWVRVEGLGKHWARADLRAKRESGGAVSIRTTNVTALKLSLNDARSVTINGQTLAPSPGEPLMFRLVGDQWELGAPEGTRKQPGLTGPVADAFLEPFIFVRPTAEGFHGRTAQWAQNELALATKMWRDLFRGDAPSVNDTDVTAADVASKNVILWGDPASNRHIAAILDQLPLQWTRQELKFGGRTYDASRHMPILILPNPANPRRYVVLNSGLDFREDAYGTNAKQTPKLPDWAIVDLDVPPGPRWPGGIAAAGFFDEQWKWTEQDAP